MALWEVQGFKRGPSLTVDSGEDNSQRIKWIFDIVKNLRKYSLRGQLNAALHNFAHGGRVREVQNLIWQKGNKNKNQDQRSQ